MRFGRHLPGVLAAALLVASCQAPPGQVGAQGGARAKTAAAPAAAAGGPVAQVGVSPGPATGQGQLLPPGAGSLAPITLAGLVRAPLAIIRNSGALVGQDGSTLIGQDGGSLVGQDGSTLIGQDGGTLIGQDGGTLIGSSGSTVIGSSGSTVIGSSGSTFTGGAAQRRLLAVTGQAPVAGAVVRLLTAAGEPVLANGVPITATTDGAGAYAFKNVIPGGNLVVVVDLGADAKAQLRAIATADAGVRKVDVEIVSTLTTAYILGRYVAGQGDQTATLNKLTPAAEAATRAATESLLTKVRIAVPATLTPAGLLNVVDALRRNSQELDQQYEVVKRLLVAAGLADLGSGALATTVPFGDIDSITYAPDGGVWFNVDTDHRIWRLLPDGRIETAVGSGSEGGQAIEGLPAATISLGALFQVATDSAGRLLFSDAVGSDARAMRISRVNRDAVHSVTVIGQVPYLQGFVPGEGDEVWAYASDVDEKSFGLTTAKLGTLAPGKPFEPKLTIADMGEVKLSDGALVARDAKGLLILRSPGFRYFTIDPAGAGAVPQPLALPGAVDVDGAGNWFEDRTVGANRLALSLHRVAGGEAELAPFELHGDLEVEAHDRGRFVLAPDGMVYGAEGQQVWRYGDGQRVRVAGIVSATSDSGAVPLLTPGGVAVGSKGELYVADQGADRIYRITPDHKTALFAGNPAAPPKSLRNGSGAYSDDGAQASEAFLFRPVRLAMEASGALLVQDDGSGFRDTNLFEPENEVEWRLRRIAPDGTVTTLYVGPPDEPLEFAVAPNGQIYYVSGALIYKLGTKEPIFDLEDSGVVIGLAVGADGTLYMATQSEILRWAPGDTEAESIMGNDDLELVQATDNSVRHLLAIDGKGRLYVTGSDDGQVYRYDPASDRLTAFTGRGTAHFAGSGVDESVVTSAYPTIDARGDLYFADMGHRQIKHIPAGEL